MTRARRERLAAFAGFRLETHTPPPPKSAPPEPEPEEKTAAAAECGPVAKDEAEDGGAAGAGDGGAATGKDAQSGTVAEHPAGTGRPAQDGHKPQKKARGATQRRPPVRRILLPHARRKVFGHLLVAAGVDREDELPAFFTAERPMPGKVGIRRDFMERYNIGGKDSKRKQALSAAVAYFFNSLAYFDAVIAEQHRCDLDLNPVEPVSDDDRQYARTRRSAILETIRERRKNSTGEAPPASEPAADRQAGKQE